MKQNSGDYAGNLIQVIEIGFSENLKLWKSKENNQDIRPSSVIDRCSNNFIGILWLDAVNGSIPWIV